MPTFSHVECESRWESVQQYLSLGNCQMTQNLNCFDVKQNCVIRTCQKCYTAVARLGTVFGVCEFSGHSTILIKCRGLNTLDNVLRCLRDLDPLGNKSCLFLHTVDFHFRCCYEYPVWLLSCSCASTRVFFLLQCTASI